MIHDQLTTALHGMRYWLHLRSTTGKQYARLICTKPACWRKQRINATWNSRQSLPTATTVDIQQTFGNKVSNHQIKSETTQLH